jgi:hypothetical protein
MSQDIRESFTPHNTPAKPVISAPMARLALAASIAVLLLLAALHITSPQFDPAWRMVSEYANGQYGWVLSLMFVFWAASYWALAFTIGPQLSTRGGRVGLGFLVAAGVGAGMGALFDINHPLHDVAGVIGIASLPIAALLISASLIRNPAFAGAKKMLLWTANLTWISDLLLVAAFIVMIITFMQTGAPLPAEPPTMLPAGVIGVVGWANRLLIVIHCAWVMTVAWQALRARGEKMGGLMAQV